MNKPVAPANADIATDTVEAPILFLKISVALAAVEVWKKEEGKRGVRDRKAAAGQVRARANYLRALLLIICIEAGLHECVVGVYSRGWSNVLFLFLYFRFLSFQLEVYLVPE